MTHSLMQGASLTCPDCGRDFDAEIWLVVDADERPDLFDRIRDGALHTVACSHCGAAGEVDAPLLLYRPGEDPALIFSPPADVLYDEDDNADDLEEQAAELLLFLQGALGPAWRDEWLDEMAVAPVFMLPVTLSENPNMAAKQMADQMMENLERLQEEDPEAFREIVEAAFELAEELEGALTPEQIAVIKSPLLPVVGDFVDGDSWEESYHFVKAHPELLGEEAEGIFAAFIQMARREDDEETADYWEEHLFLLHRCRKIGVKEAFAEKMGIPPVALS